MSVIALLPGDGIGREVLDGPVAYLSHLAKNGAPVTLVGPLAYGSSGWQETGSTLPSATVEACRTADVILSGAVGSHPGVSPTECPQPEEALVRLRHMFDLRISVRTVWTPDGADVTIVRNITGGAYVAAEDRVESDGVAPASDRMVLRPDRVREVLALAATYAQADSGRRRLSVDKASLFATSRLWRRLAQEASARGPVSFENVNVDRAAFELVAYEELPEVIATEGIFGDILSDVLGARAGSPALCGSATINPDRPPHAPSGLFEPAHGSSPHRTGSRRSNPTGAWLALASLFDWCPDSGGLGERVRAALRDVYAEGLRTYDMAGQPGTVQVTLDEFNERVLALLIGDTTP